MMSDETEDILSVGHVSLPVFSMMRHVATGFGWIVGLRDVRFSDGRHAVHAHCTFEDRGEAERMVEECRRKMS